MYTNNAYLNNSTIDIKDKTKPLIVTSCGTYKLHTRPKLPTCVYAKFLSGYKDTSRPL